MLFPSQEEIKQRKIDRDKRRREREKENLEREEVVRLAKEQKDRQLVLEKELYWANYKKLRQEIEAMPIYTNWKNTAIAKSGGRCEMCGETTGLQVHHRVSFHKIITHYRVTNIMEAFQCHALWEVSNGSVLCEDCHNKMESSKTYQKNN